MFFESLQNINVNITASCKTLWLSSSLVGSEDCLVSDKIMSLIGDDLKKF